MDKQQIVDLYRVIYCSKEAGDPANTQRVNEVAKAATTSTPAVDVRADSLRKKCNYLRMGLVHSKQANDDYPAINNVNPVVNRPNATSTYSGIGLNTGNPAIENRKTQLEQRKSVAGQMPRAASTVGYDVARGVGQSPAATTLGVINQAPMDLVGGVAQLPYLAGNIYSAVKGEEYTPSAAVNGLNKFGTYLTEENPRQLGLNQNGGTAFDPAENMDNVKGPVTGVTNTTTGQKVNQTINNTISLGAQTMMPGGNIFKMRKLIPGLAHPEEAVKVIKPATQALTKARQAAPALTPVPVR